MKKQQKNYVKTNITLEIDKENEQKQNRLGKQTKTKLNMQVHVL